MPRQRRPSTASIRSREQDAVNGSGQEMGSMYDYLAKVILLGPSGCGKSCLLHRFVQGEWRVLTSQTVGVDFASKIVKVGTPGRRKRVKLQLFDTMGTEKFRSISRSYYRGAAGALLVYDVTNAASLAQMQTFLSDARALASPQLTALLVGNKLDLANPESQAQVLSSSGDEPDSLPSAYSSPLDTSVGSQQRASVSPTGRAVSQSAAALWASQNGIPAYLETSALSGDGVDEVFNKLARTILTRIELGEINPDDPMSGIQYGDADYHRYDDGSSVKSGLTADGGGTTRRRRRRGGLGLGEWGEVFGVGQPRARRAGRCC